MDAGYGEATELRLGLEQRGPQYVVAGTATTSADAADAEPKLIASSGRARPPKPRYRDAPSNLPELTVAAGSMPILLPTPKGATDAVAHDMT